MTIAAMKQALEALEDVFGKNKVDDGYNHPTQQGLREQQEKNMYEQQENIKRGNCITPEQQNLEAPTLIHVVAKHEQEIQELKRLVTPMMQFNPEKRTAKCAVKDCESRMGQEYFNGFLCTPCHQFVSGEGGLNSKAYWNSQKMIDTAITMERGRVANLLEHLDMKAQPYHNYYKHAAKVISGKPEEGGAI